MVDQDEIFMRMALDEARKAFEAGDVPVGVVLVCDSDIIIRAHNRCEIESNPLLHAEMLALDAAFKMNVKREDLHRFTLYVTLEPCVMCSAAIMLSRIGRVVYAARDNKLGGIESFFSFPNEPAFGHNIKIRGGVLERESAALLNLFFRNLRGEKEK